MKIKIDIKTAQNESLSKHACQPSETKAGKKKRRAPLTTGRMQCVTEIHYIILTAKIH